MKLRITVAIVVIAVFLLLTYIFSDNSAAADGDDLLGFPFKFYRYTEAKLTDPMYRSHYGFFFINLLYDIIILLICIIGANFMVTKFQKKSI